MFVLEGEAPAAGSGGNGHDFAERLKYLTDEKRIKAVTVMFLSDLRRPSAHAGL